MKKVFVKVVMVMALTVMIAANITTIAKAHHSHSSDRAPQSTTCHQNSRCDDDVYCDTNETYRDEAYCDTIETCDTEIACEGRKHHARFYCGSRAEYYSRKNCKTDCYY